MRLCALRSALLLTLATCQALLVLPPNVVASSADDNSAGGEPQSFDDLLAAADAHIEAGRLLAALDLYESATAKEPDSYLGHWKCATTRLALGKQAHVMETLTKVLTLKPDFTQARLERAKLHAADGDFPQAREDLGAMAGTAEKLAADADLLHGDIESAEKAQGKMEEALAASDFEECTSQATEVLRTATNMASLRRIRARCYIGLGDITQAINDYSRAVSLEPEDADTHIIAARLKFFALDSPQVAIAHVKQCLHFDPEHKRCKALFRQLKKLDKSVRAATDDFDAKKWSAAMRKVAGPVGKPEEGVGNSALVGIEELEQELGVPGKLPRRLYGRLAGIACRGYAELKLVDKAMRWCNAALEQDSDNVDAYIARGDMHLVREDLDDALSDFTNAKEKSGGDGDHRIRERINRTKSLQAKKPRKDYYKTLGISRDASKREIKRAYRKLAQQWHPDTYSGNLPADKVETKMSELNEAYEVLNDDDKRAQFDQGVDPNNPQGNQQYQYHQHFGGGGGSGGRSGGGGGGFQYPAGDDPFQFFFGRQGGFQFQFQN